MDGFQGVFDVVPIQMAILGAGEEIKVALRLDEAELLTDVFLSTDNRLQLTCVIADAEFSDSETLQCSQYFDLLQGSGYEVKAVRAELDPSFVIVDGELHVIEFPVRVRSGAPPNVLKQYADVWEKLDNFPSIQIPLFRDPELFPEEGEPGEEFAERLTDDEFKLVRPFRQEALRVLAADPARMFEMHPRDFEELVAKLLERLDMDVELTPATRDGGRDILARPKNDIASLLILVECKRYAPDRLVGVDRVRSLYGVVEQERASAGLVVTTSHFTASAVEFASKLHDRMSLRGYEDLVKWIRKK